MNYDDGELMMFPIHLTIQVKGAAKVWQVIEQNEEWSTKAEKAEFKSHYNDCKNKRLISQSFVAAAIRPPPGSQEGDGNFT